MQPKTLSDYYTGQGKALPATAAERFADPAFATAAKSAGYDANTYQVNGANEDANKKILGFLNTGSRAAAAGATTPPGGTPTTDTTIAPKPADYYSRMPGTYDSSIESDNTALSSTLGVAPDEATILAKKKADAQTLIDSVTAEFNRQLADQTKVNDANSGRVRALNINSGTSGSNFASSAASKQDTENQHTLDLINQEKEAKISAILADVEDRSSEQYKTEREDYIKSIQGDLDRQTALKDADRKRAEESLTGLASSGVSLDALKANSPDVYKQLKTEYGGSDYELESAYNSSLPAELKTTYETHVVQGPDGGAQLLRYGVNPLTKNLESKTYDLGTDYATYAGQKPIELSKGGTLVVPDGKGGYKTVASGAGTGGSGGPDVDSFTQILNDRTEVDPETGEPQPGSGYSVMGNDNYVDPAQYKNAFAAWQTQGGTATTFIKAFPPANYINPAANASLPTYLQNLKNQPKAPGGRTIIPVQ